jgi:hypothetical protein
MSGISGFTLEQIAWANVLKNKICGIEIFLEKRTFIEIQLNSEV